MTRAFNIDCIAYMKSCEDNSFDLAIVDPPYNLKKKSVQGSGKLKNRVLNKGNMKWDVAPTKEYFDELFRVSKNQIIWGGNYFNLPPCRCFVCWDKQQPWQNFSQVEFAWTSFDKPAKLFKHTSRIPGKFHPTQKCVELYAYLLKTFAQKGDKILDTHMGSGSSRIAAHMMGFDYVGCEINKDYFDMSERWFEEQCLNQPSLF